jgi:PST family polysaccharide transporter
MMIGLLVTARPFIITVFGADWKAVIPIVQIFCLTGMIHSVGTTVGWIYTSQGRTDLMFKWGLAAGVVLACSFVIGLRWGPIGVAAAYAISGYAIIWYPSWTIPGRLIDLSFAEMLRNLSPVFWSAVIMGCAVSLLGLLLPASLPQWLCLCVQVSAGVLLYCSLIHSFRVAAYVDLKAVIGDHRRASRDGSIARGFKSQP